MEKRSGRRIAAANQPQRHGCVQPNTTTTKIDSVRHIAEHQDTGVPPGRTRASRLAVGCRHAVLSPRAHSPHDARQHAQPRRAIALHLMRAVPPRRRGQHRDLAGQRARARLRPARMVCTRCGIIGIARLIGRPPVRPPVRSGQSYVGPAWTHRRAAPRRAPRLPRARRRASGVPVLSELGHSGRRIGTSRPHLLRFRESPHVSRRGGGAC
jgi:hypothetical protein